MSFPRSVPSLPRADMSFPRGDTSFPRAGTLFPHTDTSFPHAATLFRRGETSFPSVPTTYPPVPAMIRAGPTSRARPWAASAARTSTSAARAVLRGVSSKRSRCLSGARRGRRTPTFYSLGHPACPGTTLGDYRPTVINRLFEIPSPFGRGPGSGDQETAISDRAWLSVPPFLDSLSWSSRYPLPRRPRSRCEREIRAVSSGG